MITIILRWVLNALVLMIIPRIVQGISISNFSSALIAVLILGLVNALIRPILLIFTLPINILTLGLFTLVVNALMFWLVSTIVPGFNITNFWAAFWGALVYSIISIIINSFDR